MNRYVRMNARLAIIVVLAALTAPACASTSASIEESLRRERDEWIRIAVQYEEELDRLNWSICSALWDWAYSVDPSWEDERPARFVESIEDDFEYWQEWGDYYDGFCYWGGERLRTP